MTPGGVEDRPAAFLGEHLKMPPAFKHIARQMSWPNLQEFRFFWSG
jgi:hypothetical protein